MIKKITSTVLLASFMFLTVSPLSAETKENKDSLYYFLKTTDKITAKNVYPNLIASAYSGGKSVLQAHTPILIKCEDTITTKDIVTGGTVTFSVVSDVKDNNGNVLIKTGSPVTAQISFAKDKGMIGRSGELTISDFHATAVDGTYVPLSGSVSAKPDDKMTLSIVLSVLICPLFLLMKGEEAQLPAGTQKTAYTITEVYINPVRL